MKVRTVSVSVCGTIVLIALSLACADSVRGPVSGFGWADLNLATGAADGKATLVIEGATLVALVHVQLGEQFISDDGVLHAEASHTFNLPGGSITTTDKGVVELATGTLNEHLTITSGTGDFEGVSGDLSVHGQVQFPSPGAPPIAYVSYDIRGVLSR
jgi:hypothetical protein